MRIYKERNKKLLIFLAVFLLFYGFYQLFNFPTFLFPQEDRYKDFATINYAMKDMNPYISWLSNYPPLILAFSIIFTRMNDWHVYRPWNLQEAFYEPEYMRSLIILFVIYAVFLVVACVLYGILENKRQKGLKGSEKAINILITVVLAGVFFISAPSRFMMDRGNYLVVTIVLMVLWAVFEEMKPDSTAGSVFVALAAATKVYPVYLLGTYLTEKKWKKLFTAIAVGAVVTLVPVFFFDGPYFTNLIEFAKGVAGFGGGGGVYSVYYTVGVTGLTGVLFTMISLIPRGNVTKLAWLAAGGIFTFAGFGFLCKEEKTWKKLLIVTCLMIFLSPNSYLYNSCYLFAPLLIMLMDNDKLKKEDIPYYVMTALLLVPKSYFYFPDWGEGVPTEYKHVNIAVFFDCVLYLGIIVYYLAGKIIKYSRELKAVPEEKKVKLVLSDKELKIYKIIAAAVTAIFGVYLVYFLRGTVLACHDSLFDFFMARSNPFTKGFTDCFTYGLARGRVGIIFPAVVAFRYLINGTGNYFLIWLLQYVPIAANIVLISYIISKKIDKVYGFAFAICFMGLLQIDVWHSLIVCYPLDFMYGLFITIFGCYLYSEYLLNLGNKESKKNIVRLILSLVMFYESMQVYEAFIASSLIYAVITLYFAMKNAEGFKGRVLYFVKKIAPHFIVAVVYLLILVILRSHPVVDIAVSEFGNEFNFKRFIITYVVLSFGMFPLFDFRMLPGLLTLGLSKRGLIFGVLGAAGFFAVFRFAGHYYSSLNSDARKRINRILGVIAACGILFALTFAIPHSLLPVYEEWVVDDFTGGYVPTTICYFGWSVAIFAFVMLLSHYMSRVQNKMRMLVSVGLACVFAASVYVTCCVNAQFKDTVSSTGIWFSDRVQGFWAVMNNDDFKASHPDLIYAPNMFGIHGDIANNDEFFDSEFGYDLDIINNLENIPNPVESYDNAYILVYDDFDGICYVASLANEYPESTDKLSTNEINVVARRGGVFTIRYYAIDGDVIRTYSEEITVDSGEYTEITLAYPALTQTIDFTRE